MVFCYIPLLFKGQRTIQLGSVSSGHFQFGNGECHVRGSNCTMIPSCHIPVLLIITLTSHYSQWSLQLITYHIINELTKLASTVVIRLFSSSLLQKGGGGGGSKVRSGWENCQVVYMHFKNFQGLKQKMQSEQHKWWKRNDTAWPCWGEPSSDHAVLRWAWQQLCRAEVSLAATMPCWGEPGSDHAVLNWAWQRPCRAEVNLAAIMLSWGEPGSDHAVLRWAWQQPCSAEVSLAATTLCWGEPGSDHAVLKRA
jgi:hypothetical protein